MVVAGRIWDPIGTQQTHVGCFSSLILQYTTTRISLYPLWGPNPAIRTLPPTRQEASPHWLCWSQPDVARQCWPTSDLRQRRATPSNLATRGKPATWRALQVARLPGWNFFQVRKGRQVARLDRQVGSQVRLRLLNFQENEIFQSSFFCLFFLKIIHY